MQKVDIEQRIPHAGEMVLIDEVLEYNNNTIVAISNVLRAANPLLCSGKWLPEVTIEYAAQCAAIHASLSESTLSADKPAFIASVKRFEIQALNNDRSIDLLRFEVTLEMNTPLGVSYSFICYADGLMWTKGVMSLMHAPKQ